MKEIKVFLNIVLRHLYIFCVYVSVEQSEKKIVVVMKTKHCGSSFETKTRKRDES